MKSLQDYINIVQENKSPREGDHFDIVLNEEFSIQTDVVAVEDNNVYIGLDENAFALLERAGLLELADDPGYQGSTGTALGGKPATPAAAGAKPIQSGAGLRAAQQKAAATGSPAPSPGYSKQYPVTNAMTAQMAQGTSGRYGTSTNPGATAKPGAAKPRAVPNPNQAAVDAANKVQADQTAAVAAANAPSAQASADLDAAKKNAIGGGATPQSAEPTPAPQANALGVMPQANIPGSPTGIAPATNTPAPQANPFGVMPQAQVAGSPTATAQPAAAQTSTSKTPGLDSATTPQGQAVGGETVPTRGGPAVTGGFGQETNVSTRSADEIAATGPMGIKKPTAADRAQGEKNWRGIKNFFTGGNKPAANTTTPAANTTTPTPPAPPGGEVNAVPSPNIETKPLDTAAAPATMAEDFNRMLELAGVRRG